MMKQSVFIDTLEKLEKSKTVYGLGMWGQPITESIIASKSKQLPSWYANNASRLRAYIGKGYFGFDCVCMIKSILWGFNFDLNDKNGGAKYASNGVPDVGSESILNHCTEVSTDFTKIVPGAVVWIKGHVGVYIGNGVVIECTAAWTKNVLRSYLGNLGYKGTYVRNWTKWGKLPWIEYEAVKPTPKYEGYLDTATESAITGWAWNNVDDSALSVDIKVYKEKSLTKTLVATANKYRDDLKNAKKGNGSHGFSIAFDFKSLGAGTYTVEAYTNGVRLSNTKTVVIEAPKVEPPKPIPTTPSTSEEFKDGDVIKLVEGCTYHNGNNIPDWVFKKTLYYRGQDDRGIIFSTLKTGAVTGVVKPENVIGATATTTKPTPRKLVEGEVIKLVDNANYYNGNNIPDWVFKKTLYYRGKNKNGIVFSTLKTGAVTGTVKPESIVGYGSTITF